MHGKQLNELTYDAAFPVETGCGGGDRQPEAGWRVTVRLERGQRRFWIA